MGILIQRQYAYSVLDEILLTLPINMHNMLFLFGVPWKGIIGDGYSYNYCTFYVINWCAYHIEMTCFFFN